MNKQQSRPTYARANTTLLLLLAAVFALASIAPIDAGFQQDKSKTQTGEAAPKLSEGELKAAKKVEAGVDAAARLQAADEFIKKYAKSEARPHIAQLVVAKIADLQDPAQRITLFENFLKLFKEPTEVRDFTPFLVDEYVKANRLEDAFRLGTSYLTNNADDVSVRAQLAIAGTAQAQNNNPAFVKQSTEYGDQAIALIEANKKPAAMTDAQWGDYRTKVLSQLYQATGLLAMVGGGDAAMAKTKLEKASALDPSNPFSYALLGNLLNGEYQQLAEQYKTAPAGAGKDEMLKKSQDKMDLIIDAYAHAIALSDGKPEYKSVYDQLRQDIEPYFKFRHNNSTDGLQQLIDKYKTPAAPQP
ncbi:MAG: hypothetical protein WKF30_03680 [Pyrinomonadaceae bacterium]